MSRDRLMRLLLRFSHCDFDVARCPAIIQEDERRPQIILVYFAGYPG